MLFLIGANTVNLHANPLPSCSDEWCHFTHPNWGYHVFRDGSLSYFSDVSFAPEFHEWMSKNCPNWPELNALFKPLYLPRTIHRDYKNEVNALWEKNHPKDKGIIRSGEEKIREEQYLAAQKEEYGRNIPYCLTEKAQNRVQQERRETEKYLQHAKDVPMVRDRVVLLAKIEEANAKTAKEQGLEKFYKKPTPWAVDKATLDAWWAETHPNGKALDAQAIKQRYKDYFVKQEWKQAHSNELESSIEEIKQWKRQNEIQEEQKRQKIYSEMPKTIDLADFPSTKANETISQTHINYLFVVGLIALGIVAGAAIVLLRRKKNLPK